MESHLLRLTGKAGNGRGLIDFLFSAYSIIRRNIRKVCLECQAKYSASVLTKRKNKGKILSMDGYDILGSLLFGTIGLVSFMIGRKRSNTKLMIIGALLMGYPYIVPSTLLMYIIGVILTAVLFLWR